MVTIVVKCRHCEESEGVVKMGKSRSGAQRCRCKSCGKTFQLDYTYEASKPGIKERILQMAINGSGVADTVRVLKVGKSTVLRTIKKKPKSASP